MDGDRFDAWTKRLAQPHSRRRLLQGLAGSLTAVGIGLVRRQTGEAVICRQSGVLCAKDAHCCSGHCLDYHCECPADFLQCGTACIPASGCCTDDECDDGDICTTDTCVDNGCVHSPIAGCCHTVEECPTPTQPCQVATCTDHQCGVAPQLAGTVCRAATEPCELDAVCDGSGDACPANPVKPSTTVCRAAATECEADAYCTGDSASCPANPIQTGSPCGTGPTCTDGTAKAQDTCDGQGTCQPGLTTACAPYRCNGAETGCATSCAADTDCLGTAYCASGQCVDDLANGQPCNRDSQCQSGHCVGGTCCATTCTAPEQATATCSDGTTCAFTCNPAYHDCAGSCVSDTDVAHCGTSCSPCPEPAYGGAATCDGSTCGVTCYSGYRACAGTATCCPVGVACTSDGTCPCQPPGTACLPFFTCDACCTQPLRCNSDDQCQCCLPPGTDCTLGEGGTCVFCCSLGTACEINGSRCFCE